MIAVENESGVYFAKRGYYKGKEVTVTHRHGSMVWVEDYPINGDDGLIVGCWVPSESVSYTSEEKTKQKPNSNKKRHQKRNK